jgi:RNA polymerase sigma factor (sigma-70 family)
MLIAKRAQALIDLINNKKFKVFTEPSFDKKSMHSVITGPMPRIKEFNEKRIEVRKLKQPSIPAELLPLYQEPLLDRDQEYHLFRKMNFYKYHARKLIKRLKSKALKSEIKQIDNLLHLADQEKHQIVCSNTRLAVQVLRRRTDFYRSHSLTHDLISDAYLHIVKAVECFDFTRGFKFSTYATWVLLNNFSRDIGGERKFNEQFVTGFDDAIYDTRLDTKDEDTRDVFENSELVKKNVSRLLGLLDREEDSRKRYVIEHWFGLKGPKRTLKSISEDLGLTKERVRQLRERGLERIKERLMAGDVRLD